MSGKIIYFVLCVSSVSAKYTSDYYTAAVFEHVRFDDHKDRSAAVKRNLDTFDQAASDAASMEADIIVFPEIGIMPADLTRKLMMEYFERVPDIPPSSSWVPCLQSPGSNITVLTRLSCIARNHSIYLVANIGEKYACSPLNDTRCPADYKTLFYNTDVVFDSNGTLVAKHRKRFPFFEQNISRPKSPEYTRFNTSFGSFGVIICFDTLFADAVDLVEKYKVENVIVSTWWFDELPFLSALEYYQSWGLGNGVNVLVANVHKPESGSIGSLIASGVHGALNYTFKPNRNSSELVVARVPRNQKYNITTESFQAKPASAKHGDYHHQNEDMTNYTLTPLKKTSDSLVACNSGLCCSLNYSSKSEPKNFYLAAFNGTKRIQNYYFLCQEICALVLCTNSGCSAFTENSDVVFDRVSVSGNITTPHQYPVVFGSGGTKLVPRSLWDFSRGSISFRSGSVHVPIVTVAIHGRCYDRDPPFPDSVYS